MLELKRVSPDDGSDIYRMLQEIPREENGLLNHANGLTFDEYREWLMKQYRLSLQEGLEDGWKVPTVLFWLYADGIPVGFGKVRRFLTDALRREGGNIGYAIAPSFRGKGYGNEILRLLLEEASAMGIEKALVTVRPDNRASLAVALANGGVVTERTDERIYIWIDLKQPGDPKSPEIQAMAERVREMEDRLNRAEAAVKALDRALEAYGAVREDIAALTGYYESRQWLADFDAQDALPAGQPRGVLSEDGICNLLLADKELREDLQALAEDK
jgi:predicted acetyltransferase